MQLADSIHLCIYLHVGGLTCGYLAQGLLPSVLAIGMQLRQASGMQLKPAGSMWLGEASIIWLRQASGMQLRPAGSMWLGGQVSSG